jgi:hypothetical protein
MPVLNVRDLRGPWPRDAVYVGRNPEIWRRAGGQGQPPWGNPFAMKSEADRGRVIADYTRWLADRLSREPRFKAEVASLAGKDLVCHCAPRACHGHVLEDAARTLAAGRDWTGRDADPQTSARETPGFADRTAAQEGQDTRIMRAALAAGLPDALRADPAPEAAALREAYRVLSLAMKDAGRLVRAEDGRWEIHPTRPQTPETKKAGLAVGSLQRALAQAAVALPDTARTPLTRALVDADARLAETAARPVGLRRDDHAR